MVRRGDESRHFRLYFRLIRQLRLDASGAVIEELSRRALAALRLGGVRGREQALEKVLHRLRLARLALRAARLHGGRDEAAHEREDHDRRCRRHHAVPPQELRETIGEPIAAGRHGQALQVPVDVVGQGLGRRVSPLRILLQGPQDDAIEVTAKPPAPVPPGSAG